MLKLLFTLGVFLMLALALLGLRQRQTELTAESARLTGKIQEREEKLAGQAVEITKQTNPLTLAQKLKASGIDLGVTGERLEAVPTEGDHGTGGGTRRRGSPSGGVGRRDTDRELVPGRR